MSQRLRLQELAWVFLKFGLIGFGGPQAEIALQHTETVTQRHWLTPEQFAEGLAVCELLPGPAATQVAMYIGYVRAQQLGSLVAGLAFISPAFLIVLALSWAYFRFQGLPQLTFLVFGVSPVVIAVIGGFCWKLARNTLRDWLKIAIALGALSLSLMQVNVVSLLLIAGLLGSYFYGPKSPWPGSRLYQWWVVWPGGWPELPPTITVATSLWGWEQLPDFFWPLVWFFLKIGSFVYGGGLVIVPLMETEVVDKLHWLTHTEFLAGVAIGQISPGPITLTAAFIGYKVAGISGAVVAATAMFAPSFALIMLVAPGLLKVRQSLWVQGFLQGIMPAVLGAIAAAIVPLAKAAFVQESLKLSLVAGGISVLAAVGLLRFQWPVWLLIALGALSGLLAGWLLGG